MFLLSDGTLESMIMNPCSLENASELIVCTEEQIQKLSIYFELKRYLSIKNISYPLNIDLFSMMFGCFKVNELGGCFFKITPRCILTTYPHPKL